MSLKQIMARYFTPGKKRSTSIGKLSNDLERFKILIDLGTFKNKDASESREASKGAREVQELMNRRIGPDANQEAAEIVDDINSGGEYLLRTFDWLMDGSYGSEKYYFIRNQLHILNTRGEKAFINSINSFVKYALQVAMLIEAPSLNRSALSRKVFPNLDARANDKVVQDAAEWLMEKAIGDSEMFS